MTFAFCADSFFLLTSPTHPPHPLPPGQLLRPVRVSAEPPQSIPPQCLHGGGAVQPGPVRFPWPLPAQKPGQRRLPAPEPPHPHHQHSGREAAGQRRAGRGGEVQARRRVSLPVLQRLPRGALRARGRSLWGGASVGASVCGPADHRSVPLLKLWKYSKQFYPKTQTQPKQGSVSCSIAAGDGVKCFKYTVEMQHLMFRTV